MQTVSLSVVAIFTILYCCLGWSIAFDTSQTHSFFKDDTFFCHHPPAKTDTISVNFPDVFSVAIEAVYAENVSAVLRVSDVIETYDKIKLISAVSRLEDGIEHQFIFNQSSNTFIFVNDSNTCTDGMPFNPFKTSDLTQNDPLLFPNNVSQSWSNSISSIVDVWKWAMNQSKVYAVNDGHIPHEHGIPVDHYFLCKKGAGDDVFEIEICLTQKDFKHPFPGINGSLPVRIDIKRFRNSSDDNATLLVEEFVGYRLSSFKTVPHDEREEAFLPPPGVPCNTSIEKSPKIPSLPANFSVSIEYFDEDGRKIAVNQLHVNNESHILAFQYSHNETGLPLAAEPQVPRGKIVHDFHSGIEYIIDSVSDTCVNVTNLPTDSPDAELDESSKRQMILKNASDLLGLHLEHSTGFYYVGQRFIDGDIPADVWLAYKHENETSGGKTRVRTIVHEAYFSKPDWQSYTTIGSVQKPVLLAVKIYEWPASDEPKSAPTVKTLRYHDLTAYQNVPWRAFDVTPCLNISKNDSYLVAYGNDALVNVDKAGRGQVEEALRKAIADAAQVSPLRVTNFYFEAVNDSFWVFFFIADRPKVDGTKTAWYEKEPISAKDARLNLNKSMNANPLRIQVTLEDGGSYAVALNKSSLSAVPPFFSTPVIHTEVKSGGYTGGSMAALGICMLLIGGVCGMVLAFFMWKRNRGIAYQIYE